MLPPLGLSLTSVTPRVDRLFCLEVFSHLPRSHARHPGDDSSRSGGEFRSSPSPKHAEPGGWGGGGGGRWLSKGAAV